MSFPVFVLSIDSGDYYRFESLDAMESHVERIDIDNHEYRAWDANGYPLLLRYEEGIKLERASEKDEHSELISSFEKLGARLGRSTPNSADLDTVFRAVADKPRGLFGKFFVLPGDNC